MEVPEPSGAALDEFVNIHGLGTLVTSQAWVEAHGAAKADNMVFIGRAIEKFGLAKTRRGCGCTASFLRIWRGSRSARIRCGRTARRRSRDLPFRPGGAVPPRHLECGYGAAEVVAALLVVRGAHPRHPAAAQAPRRASAEAPHFRLARLARHAQREAGGAGDADLGFVEAVDLHVLQRHADHRADAEPRHEKS